jgi:hypothetical protein
MIDIEEQLRQELRSIAERANPESIRPLRVPPPRRQSKTVRWLAPVAAAAAVAGLIVGVTVTGHKAAQQPAVQLPPGAPKYYVTLQTELRHGILVAFATVRASATGARISSVQVVRLKSAGYAQLLAITGAANDRAFLITVPQGLEILHLAADGHVLGLTHLPKKVWDLGGVYGATGADVLSPAGTEVVLPIYQQFSPKGNECSSCRHGIAMYSVITGAIKKWLLPKGDGGVFTPWSWPGSGHEVLVQGGTNGAFLRLLDVTRPAGSLLASSRSIPAPGDSTITRMVRQGWLSQGAWLLPDKKTILRPYVWMSPAHHGEDTATVRILETSASTGRLLRVLYTVTTQVPAKVRGVSYLPTCYPESFGPAQIHVLMPCLDRFGRLDGSHFTPLPGVPVSYNFQQPFKAAAW